MACQFCEHCYLWKSKMEIKVSIKVVTEKKKIDAFENGSNENFLRLAMIIIFIL